MNIDKWWPVFLTPLLGVPLVMILIKVALRYGFMDHPGGRKQHAKETPLVGGLAIFLTVILVHWLYGTIPGDSWSLLVAMIITVVVGLIDDIYEIGHRSKLFVQIVSALIVSSGTMVQVYHIGDLVGIGDIELGKWSYMVTVISIIGLMNAINMIDGVDGLAGTVAFISLLLFAGVAAHAGDVRQGIEILILAGAIVSFLVFNLRSPWRKRASVFMGDTGGMLLGLLLAWFSIKLAGAKSSPIHPITAVWILAIPLLDMGSIMLLRMAQYKSPFYADRQHMHYVLLDAGYSVSQVVMLMAVITLAYGLIGLQMLKLDVSEFMQFCTFLGLWVGYLLALAQPSWMLKMLQHVMLPRSSTGR